MSKSKKIEELEKRVSDLEHAMHQIMMDKQKEKQDKPQYFG
ncbi:hypothetical protein ACKXGF_05100 [Alkalibacillus sp. S2W]|nr:hypothetical protein [Alkalibacillus almallahensis]NIK12865.1 hypothetical protein [Alkalibacillus almallahensis]